MNYEQILTVFAIIATNLGTVIALFVHSDKKMDVNRIQSDKKMEDNRRETNAILNGIREDIREFHGRLEKQDAEFKSHMMHAHGGKK